MADVVLNSKRANKPKKRNKSKTRTQSEDEVPLSASSEARDQTKAKFNELLQQAVTDTREQDGKSGRKKKAKTSDAVLESLRKGDGIRKDEEDKTILANMYDPDDVKSRKSNKRRQQEQLQETEDQGVENLAYEDETQTRKVKKKKPKKKEAIDKDMSISELAESLKDNNKEPVSPPQDRGKSPVQREEKKKKKKKKRSPQDEEGEADQALTGDLEGTDELAGSQDRLTQDDLDEKEAEPVKSKAKRKRKKKRQQEEADDADGSQLLGEDGAASGEGQVDSPLPLVIEDQGRIVGITVHRTDKLKTDFFISHPLVRIHMVDMETGNYLKKHDKNRAVTSYYEAHNDKVDSILPIMTQPFDFKKRRSTLPVWEEIVIFNENYQYIIHEDVKVILFFEVVDFLSINTANQKYNTAKQDGGWHRIAWAFLKVVGATGQPNCDKKVRLQLFQPPLRFRAQPGQLEIYQWWKSNLKMPYPSTLYVTVKGITPPDKVEPSARSMFPTQQEIGKMSYDELQKTLDQGTSKVDDPRKKGPSLWNRLPGQVCKVPNCLMMSLSAGKKGCYVLKFSHDGRTLACACHDKDGYPILLYEMPSGKLQGTLFGHYGIIYDLCWSRKDKTLLSASSDGTARVWDMEKLSNTPKKLLPHPAFVYTASFHNRVNKVIVTGCYDRILRVWSTQGDGPNAQLLQELDGHLSYINSLAFDDEGSKMYTADSLGMIRVWNVYVTDQPSKRGVLRDWSLNREIKNPEFEGVAINCLRIHPAGRRLLVHCRDNTLRMMDLRVNSVMTRYMGAINFREHLRCTFSPCGTFVLAGSEDCAAYVWNTNTGDHVAMYAELSYQHPVSDVAFHPHDNMVAFCAFGENHPIHIYRYDHKVAQTGAGLDDSSELKLTGRPGSPEMRPGASKFDEDDMLSGGETSRSLREDFRTRDTARMERVTQKLNSVLAFQNMRPGSPDRHPLAVPPSPGSSLAFGHTSNLQSTWGSTFDTSALGMYSPAQGMSMELADPFPKLGSPEPGAFSPHASGTLTATMQQTQYAAQAQYMKQSASGWRPGFSSVGRRGGYIPPHSSRPPQIGINAMQGKPQFTYQGPPSRSETPIQDQIGVASSPNTSLQPAYQPVAYGQPMPQVHPMGSHLAVVYRRPLGQVVALYDYQRSRSDELDFVRGDIIVVLYKDNDNWWMGQLLTTGQQGFFPANYVAERGSAEAEELDDDDHNAADEEDEVRSSRASGITTAVVTKSGDLKFVSDEEEEEDTPRKRTRKKHMKKRDSQETLLTIEDEVNTSSLRPGRRKKTKDRKKESTA